MKIKRMVNALPARSSLDVWEIVVDLVTNDESTDAGCLDSISGIVASVITDEFPKENPIVFFGVGPRLVIYCQYDASSMDEENIDSLSWNPTAGDWSLAIPSDAKNLEWIRKACRQVSGRIQVYDIAKGFEDTQNGQVTESSSFEIDWNAGA